MAEFANAVPDTGIRINNSSTGGRVFTLFSSGFLSGLGAGTFHIYDATAGQDRFAIDASGNVYLPVLGPGGTTLCHNGARITDCSSSSLRYKKDLAVFSRGLDVLTRLRPISFTWKDHPERDFGLAAEDVAAVEPLLVTHNAKGQIEGIKYDRLSVVLINAIKEQQKQIEQLKKEIRQLRVVTRRRGRLRRSSTN